jgi:hypothetical protein
MKRGTIDTDTAAIASVTSVTQQRVPFSTQMNSNLVLPPGLNSYPRMESVGILFQNLHLRQRPLTLDRRIQAHHGLGGPTCGKAFINLFGLVILKHIVERTMCLFTSCENQ